ncbi:MAG: RpiB/LacA/LacB family sugar-phosphate isomerase [bacterium]|nr:RpiB/LacA/LacB family sugar-phosphate isomerase [bacterium]
MTQHMSAKGGSAFGGKIYIGADHAGYKLKQALVQALIDAGYEVADKGAFEYVEEDDYPNYIAPVADEVSKDPENCRGIVIGGSGQGEAMVANKFPGVRAAVYYGGDSTLVTLSREHNDSNILSLGARFLSEDEAKAAVKLWLETPFSNEERHKRRIAKVDDLQP